jgi:hypothetical protein
VAHRNDRLHRAEGVRDPEHPYKVPDLRVPPPRKPARARYAFLVVPSNPMRVQRDP